MKFSLPYIIFLCLLGKYLSAQQTEVILNNAEIFSDNWFSDLEEAKRQPDKVYYLDLSLQKLKTFPVEILAFTNLKKLNLAVNYYPLIPDGIGLLKNLEELDISSHYYMNTLPDALSKLTNLKRLVIEDHKLKPGEIERLKKLMPWCEIKT